MTRPLDGCSVMRLCGPPDDVLSRVGLGGAPLSPRSFRGSINYAEAPEPDCCSRVSQFRLFLGDVDRAGAPHVCHEGSLEFPCFGGQGLIRQ